MLVLPAPYKRDYCLSVPPPFVPRLIFSSRFSLLEGPKLLVGVLIVIIYIFLALLGLHSCVGFSLVVAERGLLHSCDAWVSHCGGFSCCRVQALGYTGFSSFGSWAQ